MPSSFERDNAMNILSIVDSVPRSIATEALYYCLRALKQAGLPAESKKDYFFDTEGSHPNETSVALARQILERIVAVEGRELDLLDRERIHGYIHEVANATDTLSTRVDGFNKERGAELLQRMRSA